MKPSPADNVYYLTKKYFTHKTSTDLKKTIAYLGGKFSVLVHRLVILFCTVAVCLRVCHFGYVMDVLCKRNVHLKVVSLA